MLLRSGMFKLILSVFILSVCVLSDKPCSAADDGVVRFAVTVGANYGGRGRTTLRYAVMDAREMMNVLLSIGGVKGENCLVLVDPDKKLFCENIEKIRKEIEAAKNGRSVRSEFIFYYSGHSDEDGILLGNDRVTYKDLRDMINDIQADVRIAVLDSCSSGAFTRIKGGTIMTPFITDKTNSMKGFAFMTSSSSDEVSQESERIRGSFFTHYLISGLRGAADMSRDGKVTLNEVYQYAYRETLARTQTTVGGAQHPNYDIQMNGTGDVVLTEMIRGTSSVTFGDSLSGRIFVNGDSSIIAEVSKVKGEQSYLSLNSGSYRLILEKDGALYDANVRLSKGENTTIQQAQFSPVKRESAVFRGGFGVFDSNDYEYSMFGYFFLPYKSSENGKKTNYDYIINLFGSSCYRVNKSSVGLGLSVVKEEQTGLIVSGIGNIIGGSSKGVSVSSIVNTVSENSEGVSLAGVANIIMRDAVGVYCSGIVNTAGGDMTGVQISGLSGIVSGDLYGVQASSLVNVVGGNFSGIQVSTANIVNREGKGFQLGLVNISGESSGVRVGLVNVSGESSGLGIGLLNIDSISHGVQFGIVNYSGDNDGYPIGIFTIVRKGITAPEIFVDETGLVTYAISHGNRRMYNIYTLSHKLGRLGKESDVLGQGFGIGVRWFPGDFILSADVLSTGYYANEKRASYNRNELRFSCGYTTFDRVNIYGGVSLTQMKQVTNGDDQKETPIKPPWKMWQYSDSEKKPGWIWVGGFVGVRILFGND